MTPSEALSVEIEPQVTLRDWLRDVLLKFWEEGDGFSGKRPFGDSSWYQQIADVLDAVSGRDDLDVDALVAAAIREMCAP